MQKVQPKEMIVDPSNIDFPTASALKDDYDRYLSIGIDDFVSKPIVLSELNRALLQVARKL